ncbi:MAG TPA: DUF3135 domain-containing protein [Chromatiales bacterium]|nr:DUF3135 domain-containing protein [Chromatiales bacterium]
MTLRRRNEKSRFNFDAWMKLAKTNPEAFEIQRKKVLQAEIAKAPKPMQHRLTGLQWRVDMERKRCSNPTQSMIHIYKKMWHSVYGENGLLSALHANTSAQLAAASRQEAPVSRAQVLPFEVEPKD